MFVNSLLCLFGDVDEVSSTEIDMGSQPCKAGYTGEDTPKAVFPSISVVVHLLVIC